MVKAHIHHNTSTAVRDISTSQSGLKKSLRKPVKTMANGLMAKVKVKGGKSLALGVLLCGVDWSTNTAHLTLSASL